MIAIFPHSIRNFPFIVDFYYGRIFMFLNLSIIHNYMQNRLLSENNAYLDLRFRLVPYAFAPETEKQKMRDFFTDPSIENFFKDSDCNDDCSCISGNDDKAYECKCSYQSGSTMLYGMTNQPLCKYHTELDWCEANKFKRSRTIGEKEKYQTFWKILAQQPAQWIQLAFYNGIISVPVTPEGLHDKLNGVHPDVYTTNDDFDGRYPGDEIMEKMMHNVCDVKCTPHWGQYSLDVDHSCYDHYNNTNYVATYDELLCKYVQKLNSCTETVSMIPIICGAVLVVAVIVTIIIAIAKCRTNKKNIDYSIEDSSYYSRSEEV